MNDPIDYDKALRDLLAHRRRRRFDGIVSRIPDPRPTSPGQVLAIGLVLALVGWLVPGLHFVSTIGLVFLVVGFVSSMLQPRGRHVTWRNRDIDLPPDENWGHRLYRIIYRHSV